MKSGSAADSGRQVKHTNAEKSEIGRRFVPIDESMEQTSRRIHPIENRSCFKNGPGTMTLGDGGHREAKTESRKLRGGDHRRPGTASRTADLVS
jgi:hypothetical protein